MARFVVTQVTKNFRDVLDLGFQLKHWWDEFNPNVVYSDS